MRSALPLLLLFGLACATPAAPPPPPAATAPPAPESSMDLRISWTATPAPGALALRYAVTNTTDHTIWLLDRLLTVESGGWSALPDRFIVRGGAEGEALLSRGFVPPDNKVMLNVLPAATPLAAGATVIGAGTVPTPLAAWHPFGELRALGRVRTLRLELGWLDAEPAWSELTVPGQPEWRVPTAAAVGAGQRWLRGEATTAP